MLRQIPVFGTGLQRLAACDQACKVQAHPTPRNPRGAGGNGSTVGLLGDVGAL